MLKTIIDIFEIVMIVCFGASWPFNIIMAYKARSAKGTSVFFMFLIGFGYLAGIVGKTLLLIEDGYLSYLKIIAFVFYFINLLMVSCGIAIYYRNKKLDDAKDSSADEDS